MSFGGFYIFFNIFHFPKQVPKNNVPMSGIILFFLCLPFPPFRPLQKTEGLREMMKKGTNVWSYF